MTQRHSPRRFEADEVQALRSLGWEAPRVSPSCPDPALLVAVDGGVLDAETAARVQAHLRECACCRMLAADLVDLLDADPTEVERARISARVLARPAARMRWRAVTGAALAAAATIAFVLVRMSDVPPSPPGRPPHPSVQPPVSTVFLADRPAVAREEPELTLRGEGASSHPEQINEALDAADDGRLREAVERLAALTRRRPGSADAHLALGAVLLRSGRPSEALPVLGRARRLATPDATEEFAWYLAVALVRSGDRSRAIPILESLCRASSVRGALACAGLVEIGRSATR